MCRKILLLILIVVSLVLSGCKDDTELVEPYEMSNQTIVTMNSNTDQGTYMVNSSKEQLVIFRGIEKGIQTMSYSVKNDVLVILFETVELNQPKIYAYKINSNSSFDTIQILLDGKNEAFNTVFIQ